jgi:hydrogenase-1 operon protein HyaF
MTDDIFNRPNPMFWHDIEGPDVLSPGGGDDVFNPFELPKGVARFARPVLGPGAPANQAGARAILIELSHAMAATAADGQNRIIALADVPKEVRTLVEDALGEGEATILIAGPVEYHIQETLYPGLWDVRTCSPEGEQLDRHLEVGPTPLVVEAAARDLADDAVVLPDEAPELMNVRPLLVEIAARMADQRPRGANHVISLTNLPMSDADLAALAAAIGGGAIRAHTKGYGAARVTSTRARGVWQVEYLNSMGTVILDTIEIGGPPAALIAGREDFEDSADRLIDLIAVS